MHKQISKTLVNLTALISLLHSITSSQNAETFPRAYARSIIDLKELARLDNEIGKRFTQVYLADQILNPDSEIKRLVEIYLLDFYETSGFADFKHVLSTSNVIVSQNPICGYRLIRRVKFFLSHLVSRIVFFRTFGELARKIFFFFWENGWPSGNDQIEATNGIFKILEAQDFDVDQFANGRIPDVQTNCTLDSISCQAIAYAFRRSKDIASEIQWLDIAVEKVAEDRKTSVPFLKFWLRKSINKHNLDFDEETMMDFGDAWFDRKIQDFSGDGRRARKLRTLHRETLKRTRKLTGEYIDYWAICTGENFQTESEKSLLFCWHEFKAHGSLAIGPMKMEFLSRNPDIVQIYEVLFENETQALMSNSISYLRPSKSGSYSAEEGRYKPKTGDYLGRTSMTAWSTEAEARGISRRIERIVGMHVVGESSAESLQVASYTFAGYFDPHNDEEGDGPYRSLRIATFMFYLNDVKAGGQTAFPFLGFAVKPIKGSAILWFNLYSDGETDQSTLHGSCQVLLGEKWVATKWILLNGQFEKRKCDMEPRKRHRFQINNGATF